VSASRDRTIRVWKLDSSESVRAFQSNQGEVSAIAFAPDGFRFVAASKNDGIDQGGGITVWRLDDPEHPATCDLEASCLSAAFSPDGKHILRGDAQGNLAVFPVECGNSLNVWTGFSVTALAMFPDGAKVLSGATDA